jgi:hypothetical protein
MTPELSPEQITLLNRARQQRKQGHAINARDCDSLLALLLQVCAPSHSCVDQPSLPCPGCRWLDEGAA